jgi:hypothetical protein
MSKISKPDKDTAKTLLYYLSMGCGKSKQNLEALCGNEIQQYFSWLEDYCSEQNCTQEEALQRIIDKD